MPTLKLPRQAPPGGWRYFQPETKLWFDGSDQGVEDMCEKISSHRKYRQLVRASKAEAWEDVQAQLCERLGPEHCYAGRDEQWTPIKKDFSQNVSGEQIFAFTKVILTAAHDGKAWAPLDEVVVRADICSRCHLNTPTEGCFTCSALKVATAGLIPTQRKFPGLHVCAACGCGLELKVNVTREIIDTADEGRNLIYPKHCWLSKAPQIH